ncbi:MAG: hypothetical protein IPK83_16950 [Planctomycetes bacterium]|nr:hypothetical protein [Planctomycetota bacterium]
MKAPPGSSSATNSMSAASSRRPFASFANSAFPSTTISSSARNWLRANSRRRNICSSRKPASRWNWRVWRECHRACGGLGQRGTTVKRFKGLGEMNPEELWETTLDSSKRKLLQVVISEEERNPEQLEIDWRAADRIFSILMGENVEVRREFIETNAIHVKDLDI